MFSQPTVFVVGAGASCEFGMPSGEKLKSLVQEKLDFRADRGMLIGDNDFHSMLRTKFDQEAPRYFEEARELSRMIREVRFDSMDEVLHWFSSSQEKIALGKAVIVREILAFERSTARPLSATPGTWLPDFLSMVIGSLKREDITSAFSNVTIINFNYDRLIEHYFYSELQTALKFEELKAKEVVTHLKMIRPYGKIGPLPWQDSSSAKLPFGADRIADYDALFGFSENILTYTEQKTSDDVRAAIKEAMTQARLIVFLGFGFHQQNMRILQSGNRVGKKQVLATVMGIHPENYDNMCAAISADVSCTAAPQLLRMTAAELMENMRPTLLIPIR